MRWGELSESELPWFEVKWSEVKWNEVRWVRWSEVKWSELKRNYICLQQIASHLRQTLTFAGGLTEHNPSGQKNIKIPNEFQCVFAPWKCKWSNGGPRPPQMWRSIRLPTPNDRTYKKNLKTKHFPLLVGCSRLQSPPLINVRAWLEHISLQLADMARSRSTGAAAGSNKEL